MHTIQLERAAWEFDDQRALGPAGGFGEVFYGKRGDEVVAIKRLKLSAAEAAHREMDIARFLAGQNLEHVVPVLDVGQDPETERYYLVMPLCDHSLQELLQSEGQLGVAEACAVAMDILRGLEEAGALVHRDLKPANILWHDGRWKVADFGIAKFVEDSTSLQTLRSCLTPAYAAPEQWLGERPTNATDIYALGCTIHELVNGQVPFGGDLDDVREAHLRTPTPELGTDATRLNALVHSMLRKSPASRPSLERCRTVLEAASSASASPARAALERAALEVAKQEAEAEAKNRTEKDLASARTAQAHEARAELVRLYDRLFSEIESSTEVSVRERFAIKLGRAHLSFEAPVDASSGCAGVTRSGWKILAYSSLRLRCEVDQVAMADRPIYQYSTSLVYATTPDDSEFRWREVSFWSMNSDFWTEPRSLSPDGDDFHVALSNIAGFFSVARKPRPIDAEDQDEFIDRWLTLFTKAVSGRVRAPNQMPPPDSFYV